MIDWGQPLPAPAKLNLFLHVLGRRADGYHDLQTVFRLVDLADHLRFDRRGDGAIRLARPLTGVPEEDDLTVRAARALQEETGCRLGATIEVDKAIPMGAGLGGGSSDAATTLLALNMLWGLGLDWAALARLGRALGADVPVFVHGRNAFGEGVGEILTPIDLPPAWYVILTPPVAVPTHAIFTDPELTRNTKPTTMTAFFAGQHFGNDLEPVVLRKYPVVGSYMRWLGQYASARLTGSGSSVFATFSSEREAQAVVSELPEGMLGCVARGLDRHPMLKLLTNSPNSQHFQNSRIDE